ncbi:MAG: SAM-dependent methyltransferase [Campylobacter sp.]|nr:SAM-dependent methyltransferase [Campylobacter sp.]
MSEFREHNNREIAKANAEYITSKALRKYIANNVKAYAPKAKSVFDGAVGSGQMLEFLGIDDAFGVEIQKPSCTAFMHNFPSGKVLNKSFFEITSDEVEIKDVVVMNPPFSLKFKDLSEDEKFNIQWEFPWKKSGVVDDIFILKSLNFTKRFAFHIAFVGISYRKAEAKLRELISSRLAELNEIKNGFEDTSINVLVLVIDKLKTTPKYTSELIDIKSGEVLAKDSFEWSKERWEVAKEEIKQEKINIDEVNKGLDKAVKDSLIRHFEIALMRIEHFKDLSVNEFLEFLGEIDEIIKHYKSVVKQYAKH